MRGMLGLESTRRSIGIQHMARKRWRIQVVSEIDAYRSNGCLVAYTKTNSLRYVTIVALRRGTLLQAEPGVFLLPA